MRIVVKYRSRDLDYPAIPWWEVWMDDRLVAGFSTEAQANAYRDQAILFYGS